MPAWRGARLLGVVLLAMLDHPDAAAQAPLLPPQSVWRYFDAGTFPGAGWTLPTFDDSSWRTGPAILGYGNGDEATVLGYGPHATNKYITAYFRRTLVATNVAVFDHLDLALLRDDGAAIYLNGVEVLRDNLSYGGIDPTTRAPVAVGGADERTYFNYAISTAALLEGTNLLAVEIHQNSPTSSDLAFDLAVTGGWIPFTIESLIDDVPLDGVNGSAQLAVAVTDPAMASTNITVTIDVRPAGPSPGADFTVVVLPDTQYYTAGLNGGTPAHFVAQTDWIVRERAARNVVFVTHVGDVVEHGDNGGTNSQWSAAADALYRLENPVTTGLPEGIPYGVAVGNHDQSPNGNSEGSTLLYNNFFGTNRFAGRSYYGGHFGTNNDTHFELFAVGGLEFVVLHLEYNTQTNPAVMAWAAETLQTHATRSALVVAHSLISPGNPGPFSAEGRVIFDALKVHPNVFLMLCGHYIGEGRREELFNGRSIHVLLADYQGRANGGDGWLRLLEFSPSNRVVRVRTYSPWRNTFETDADSAFDLPFDLDIGRPFVRAAQATATSQAPHVTVLCSNLTSATAYEWRVSAIDGARIHTSPTWRFTTGDVGESNRLALRLALQLSPAGELAFSWPSVPGRAYRVCARHDLAEPGWTDLTPRIQAVSETTSWTLPPPADTQSRFFAVRLVGPGE